MLLQSTYGALLDYLAAVPADHEAVTLRWAELERLRGRPLPPAARHASYWTSHAASRRWRLLGFAARLHPAGWTVTFRRQPPQTAQRYAPLLHYLAALPPAQTCVRLTLAEIETLSGPLSVTARTTGTYWVAVNRAHYWRRSGWMAALDRRGQRVTFTRQAR